MRSGFRKPRWRQRQPVPPPWMTPRELRAFTAQGGLGPRPQLGRAESEREHLPAHPPGLARRGSVGTTRQAGACASGRRSIAATEPPGRCQRSCECRDGDCRSHAWAELWASHGWVPSGALAGGAGGESPARQPPPGMAATAPSASPASDAWPPSIAIENGGGGASRRRWHSRVSEERGANHLCRHAQSAEAPGSQARTAAPRTCAHAFGGRANSMGAPLERDLPARTGHYTASAC